MRNVFKLIWLCIFCPLAFYGQTDGQFNCHIDLPLRECNYIPNPGFDLSDPSITSSAFSENNVSDWYDTQGSTDINRFISPFDVSINFASMGLSAGQFGTNASEGIAAKIPPLVAGNTYAFSFFIASNSITGLTPVQNGMINVALVTCQDFPDPQSMIFAPLSTPHQVIYCETLGTVGNSAWKQVFVKFTATHGFNMIRIYPSQSIPTYVSSVSFIHAAYPELIDVTNFSTGTMQFMNSCDFSIAPTNCAVKNAVFTWRDPGNNIIQQGASQQLTGSLHNNPAGGLYTLSMTVPGAAATNNTCSVNNPDIIKEVNVPGNCNCGSLSINNATFDYEWDSEVPMNLGICDTNRLCNIPFNGDDIFNFTGTSNQVNGNIWQVRMYSGALSVDPQFMLINNTNVAYPAFENFTTYSTSANGDFTLFTGNGYYDLFFEIKLINTITNTSRIIIIKVVQAGLPSPGGFYCVSAGTSICPIPHKLIYAINQPGYSYQWTLQPGMTACSGLTNAWLTWDDAGFNYNAVPNPIASVTISNVYGCTPTVTNFNINPSNCTTMRNSFTLSKSGNAQLPQVENKKETLIVPNPVVSDFRIESNRKINSSILYNSQGVILQHFNKLQNGQLISISELKSGTYFIKLFYDNNTYEVKSIIKK